MKYVYAILSWAIVALGMVHMLATLRIFHVLSSAALWFFSGGIVLVLTGTLNLLNRAYGEIAPGLRRTCVVTNLFMTIFGALSGFVTHANVAEFIIVLGVIGGAFVISLKSARAYASGNLATRR